MSRAFILLLVILILVGGIFNTELQTWWWNNATAPSTTPSSAPETRTQVSMSNSKNLNSADPLKSPAIVPLSDIQRAFIVSLIETVILVVAEQRILQEVDGILGKGKFFWPKDPKKPVRALLSFDPENFEFQTISVGFERQSERHPWTTAVMTVYPKNFPIGTFEMQLPASAFSAFTFKKATLEKHEGESFGEINVYVFSLVKNSISVELIFSARPDVSQLSDNYPRSFHKLEIRRSR